MGVNVCRWLVCTNGNTFKSFLNKMCKVWTIFNFYLECTHVTFIFWNRSLKTTIVRKECSISCSTAILILSLCEEGIPWNTEAFYIMYDISVSSSVSVRLWMNLLYGLTKETITVMMKKASTWLGWAFLGNKSCMLTNRVNYIATLNS